MNLWLTTSCCCSLNTFSGLNSWKSIGFPGVILAVISPWHLFQRSLLPSAVTPEEVEHQIVDCKMNPCHSIIDSAEVLRRPNFKTVISHLITVCTVWIRFLFQTSEKEIWRGWSLFYFRNFDDKNNVTLVLMWWNDQHKPRLARNVASSFFL